MPVPIFRGLVEDGTLYLEDYPGYVATVKRLNGPVTVTIRRYRPPKSSGQNRYLHGVVIKLLAEHCGYDPEEMRDALKWRFLRTHEGGDLPAVRSVADLDTAEMTEFIEQIRRLAAELGCVIPDPGEIE